MLATGTSNIMSRISGTAKPLERAERGNPRESRDARDVRGRDVRDVRKPFSGRHTGRREQGIREQRAGYNDSQWSRRAGGNVDGAWSHDLFRGTDDDNAMDKGKTEGEDKEGEDKDGEKARVERETSAERGDHIQATADPDGDVAMADEAKANAPSGNAPVTHRIPLNALHFEIIEEDVRQALQDRGVDVSSHIAKIFVDFDEAGRSLGTGALLVRGGNEVAREIHEKLEGWEWEGSEAIQVGEPIEFGRRAMSSIPARDRRFDGRRMDMQNRGAPFRGELRNAPNGDRRDVSRGSFSGNGSRIGIHADRWYRNDTRSGRRDAEAPSGTLRGIARNRRERSRTPMRRGNRSRSPMRRGNRSRSPMRGGNRSRSPMRRDERLRSPIRRRRSPLVSRRRSPSPVRRRDRSPSPVRRNRSPSIKQSSVQSRPLSPQVREEGADDEPAQKYRW